MFLSIQDTQDTSFLRLCFLGTLEMGKKKRWKKKEEQGRTKVCVNNGKLRLQTPSRKQIVHSTNRRDDNISVNMA